MAVEPLLADRAKLDSGAAATVAPRDLYITPELYSRDPKCTDPLGEKLALQDIAAQIVDHPEQVLPKLVERAMEITGAMSAGISAFETQEGTAGVFRWRDLKGELARFEGATTPRNYSPCGVCLDRFEPTLTRRPERHYKWIAEAGISCPEVLLVPLYLARGEPLGTLWIVSDREGRFDSGHARIMRELASFTGVALAMLQDQQRLREAVRQQEILTAEMSHRGKNLFSIVDAMIAVTKGSATSVADMATILSGRLHALAAAQALARPTFNLGANEPPQSVASLSGLIHVILKPYEVLGVERFALKGPEIRLGSRVTTGLALLIHELATNAAKYGSLSCDEGRVSVNWRQKGEVLVLQWRENGGPKIAAEPVHQGFGAVLTRDTISQFGGIATLDWRPRGLVANFALPISKLAD